MRKRQRILNWLACIGIIILSVAFLTPSVATAQRSEGTIDETAMAIPRLVLPGSDKVDFPRPLSPGDVALIHRILALQAAGSIVEADRAIADLEADWMVGPILAARYLNPNLHPTATELNDWLHRYGDQSDSVAITARLRRLETAAPASHNENSPQPRRPAARTASDGPGTIRRLFSHNRDTDAIRSGHNILLSSAAARSADDVLAAGLAAWRQNDKATALTFFAVAYNAAHDQAGRAAAAYWIAHLNEMNGQPAETTIWLRRAALGQDTFYGRIARRKLGLIHAVDTQEAPPRTLGMVDFDRLLAIPRARRIFGLLQIGDKNRAQDELRALSLDLETEPNLERILIVVASAAGMTDLAEELRTGYSTIAPIADRTLPPSLRPQGGFIVDPTIVYGIVQHESNFHTNAVSSLGALGLMQIMPSTAIGIGALPAGNGHQLATPEVNLAVGQRYIQVLANDPDIHGDLLRLLSAYGQGQGAMKRWVSAVNDGGDPLMFMEAIPSPVLRSFLFDALAASWRFAVALRLPAPSLDALADGHYPMLSHPVSGGLSAASAGSVARSNYRALAKH